MKTVLMLLLLELLFGCGVHIGTYKTGKIDRFCFTCVTWTAFDSGEDTCIPCVAVEIEK